MQKKPKTNRSLFMKNLYSIYSKLSVRAREMVQDFYVGQPMPVNAVAEKKAHYRVKKNAAKTQQNIPAETVHTASREIVKPKKRKQISEGNDILFEFRKMVLMCEMLFRKEMQMEGEELLKKLLALSYEMESLNERMQLYSLAGLYNVQLPGRDGQKKYREEMAESIRKYNESTINAHVFTSGEYQDLDFFELKKHQDQLGLLKQHYEMTGFARIGFLYHFSSLCYNAALYQFKAAIFHGERLLELVQKSPMVFAGYGIETVNQKLAACYLCTGDPNKALEKARIAVRDASNHSLIHAQSLEILFCTLFRKKEIMTLEDVIGKAQRNHAVKYDRFLSGKWKMLHACLLFEQDQFKEAQKQLKACCGLPREKVEWVLYTQLLDVMCKAETGQHDWFYYRAEALRKSISRYEAKHRHHKNGRISLIYRLLKTLHRNEMDYQLLLEEESEALDLLRCSEGNYFWDPAGPELIRFEEWVQMKARKQIRKRGSKLVA